MVNSLHICKMLTTKKRTFLPFFGPNFFLTNLQTERLQICKLLTIKNPTYFCRFSDPPSDRASHIKLIAYDRMDLTMENISDGHTTPLTFFI